MKTPITVAHGDGIGPELMEATLKILEAAGAELDIKTIDVGLKVFERGETSGIEADAWNSILRTKILLKAPVTTPQGSGMKSLNVTLRKTLGLYANVRPCSAYAPFVPTKHPKMDVVMIRENEEDLYAGIEHQLSPNVMQCLKLVSRRGTEKIIRYAFEYAQSHGRARVSCFTKDNIMKMTDGLFHKIFDEIGTEYPDIQKDHWIVDIGAAMLADKPEMFDVIVLPNLYGDILSDVAAQIAGSVGLAGSANIGERAAMFEAIHGSAPALAGKNSANPSGLLLAGVMMLNHIGQNSAAEKIHNAWLKTIEDGIHTFDIYQKNSSAMEVSTSEFAQAVIERLGQSPLKLSPTRYFESPINIKTLPSVTIETKRELVGADIFIYAPDSNIENFAQKLHSIQDTEWNLEMICDRGLAVWTPSKIWEAQTDVLQCRFRVASTHASHATVITLLERITQTSLEFVKMELLYRYDGKDGFTRSQGQ
ncbi:MAG: NADP-dependent isocitrate dehydrogenase [Verrucomicrobiota bacterium]